MFDKTLFLYLATGREVRDFWGIKFMLPHLSVHERIFLPLALFLQTFLSVKGNTTFTPSILRHACNTVLGATVSRMFYRIPFRLSLYSLLPASIFLEKLAVQMPALLVCFLPKC